MKRGDAIKTYGHYYTFNVLDNTVREKLGALPEDRNYACASAAEAEKKLNQYFHTQAQRRVKKIDRILDRPANRLKLFMAQCGFAKKSVAVLENAARLRHEKHMLQTGIANNFHGRIKSEILPEDIKIPHALPLGQTIHIVRSDYLEQGITPYVATITERTLHKNQFGGGDWDYSFRYTAESAQGRSFEFAYDHDDCTTSEIRSNLHGHRIFLTPEAAEDHILALARSKATYFNVLAAKYAARIAQRAPANQPSGPAPQP